MLVGVDVRSIDGDPLGHILLWDKRINRQIVIIDRDHQIAGLTVDNIDPKSVRDYRGIPCVRDRKAQYGFCVNQFRSGKAVVSWCIQPDGRYWEDEDGFGGNCDMEITLYSMIDRQGHFCTPFFRPSSGSFPEIEQLLREKVSEKQC